MATKYDLPNSLIHEWQKYGELFALGDSRTTTGSGSWTSDTSSTVYNYTTGEEDLFDQLFVVLEDYLFTATDANNKAEVSDLDNVENTLTNALASHEAEKATDEQLGHVAVDGESIITNEAGVIFANPIIDDTQHKPQIAISTLFQMCAMGYGGTIQAIVVDDKYVYVGGATTQTVSKLANIILIGYKEVT